MELQIGQKIDIRYQGRILEAVIINPHAFGRNRPSIGLGYRMQERCAGINHGTISNWVKSTKNKYPESFSSIDIIEYLELPKSRKKYVVHHLPFGDKKNQTEHFNNSSFSIINPELTSESNDYYYSRVRVS